jgi:translocation and assembly module TamB
MHGQRRKVRALCCMVRRLILIFAAVVVVAALSAAAFPVWLPWVLRPLAHRAGVEVGAYERHGYKGLVLRDVRWRDAGMIVAVARVEVPTPPVWVWRAWRGVVLATPEPWLRAEGVRVELTGAPRGAALSAPGRVEPIAPGPAETLANVQRLLALADRWLPAAEATDGVVAWPGGRVVIERAGWSERRLSVAGRGPEPLPAWTLTAAWPAGRKLEVAFDAPQEALAASVQVGTTARAEGRVRWQGQEATAEVAWVGEDWWPSRGRVTAEDWRLPARVLGLDEALGEVAGSVRIGGGGREWAVEVAAASIPLDDALPPLRLVARGTSDTTAITWSELAVSLPGLEASLQDPVTVDWSGAVRAGSRFAVTADLGALPWIEAQGRLRGEASVEPREDEPWRVEFHLRGEDLRHAAWEMPAATARGTWTGEVVALDGLQLKLRGGTTVEGSGALNWATRRLDAATGRVTLVAADVARWLPEAVAWGEARAEITAAGPLSEVEHRGTATIVALELPAVQPLALSLEWTGRGWDAAQARGTVAADGAAAEWALDLARGAAGEWRAGIAQFVVRRGERELVAGEGGAVRVLAEGAEVAWEGVRLAGSAGAIETAGRLRMDGASGDVVLALRAHEPEFWQPWLRQVVPPVTVREWSAAAKWSETTAPEWRAEGAAVWARAIEGRSAVVLEGAAASTNGGVEIGRIAAREEDGPMRLRGEGKLPWQLVRREDGQWTGRLDPKGSWRILVEGEGFGRWIDPLLEPIGLEIRGAAVAVDLAGVLAAPRGTAEVRAERLRYRPVAGTMVELGAVRLAARAEGNRFELSEVGGDYEEQRVTARGWAELPDGFWVALGEGPLATAWEQTSLELELEPLPVALLARWQPELIAPLGTVAGRVELRRGLEWGGRLTLREAGLRPVLPFGSLQEVNAEIALSGRTATLRTLEATIGGAPVRGQGEARWGEGEFPELRFELAGQRVPLVRQPGLLLRADLDLRARGRADGGGSVTGAVTVREGLFLRDLAAFFPTGPRGPARRPPYFSVELEPLARWNLDVALTGREAVRVITPIYDGRLSANLRLLGTLREPRLLGEVAETRGRVSFPFARFAVQTGQVTFTEADPYTPVLEVRGLAARIGYELTMEVGGTLDAPLLTFSSTPPLTSEEILLLVTAGEVPQRADGDPNTGRRVVVLGAFLSQGLLGNRGPGWSDRLRIESGRRISELGRETYHIEYQADERWSLVGEYDEFDAYNAGLRWRVYPGRRRTAAPVEGEEAR